MITSIFQNRLKGNLFPAAALLFVFFLFCPFVYAKYISLQKPKSYTGKEDVSGWVMSEKLDGIRGYWDGTRLFTRKGVPLNSPSWFTQDFPPFELDGELWSGRGEYEFIQSVVLDDGPGDGWGKISYNIFEVPNSEGDFFSRLNRAKIWFKNRPVPHVRIIPQVPVRDASDLDRFLADVESKGGEGVVVKDPKMDYHTGRSAHVLKVKNFKDMEGVVININKGKGKYENVMGSLLVRLNNGIEFKLGTGFTDQVRKNPPPVGSVVTFKYYGLTKNGVPRFASFLRVRTD